jgi:hypothetical protein
MSLAELYGEIISGTVSGVVSGALLAGTLVLFNWVRNRILESKLRRGFARCGIGLGDGTFTLIIENRLPIEARIRAVVLVGKKGQGYLDLKYMRPVSQAALLNALGQDSSPERIIAGAHFSGEGGGEAGVGLAGFSGGVWGVSHTNKDFSQQLWVIEDGWIVLEYPTLFGGSAFIRVHFDPPTLELIRKNIAEVSAYLVERSEH